MEGDWYTKFRDSNRLEFTEEGFQKAMDALEEDLPLYLEYMDEGDRVLECCCGPGYTAIPLSHFFKVTAVDRNPRILEAARENAARYGRDISFRKMDVFDLLDEYGEDSFKACSSGGVLEHFQKEDIHRLLDIQLKLAPNVFAMMPLFTKEEAADITEYGIETHHYTHTDWMQDILKDYKVLEHKRLINPDRRFREFQVVVGR